MPGESIFSNDWRDCLRAHYKAVVSEQDMRTERTLRGVMFNVGFSEAELNELRVLATMHVDDIDPDFVPDLQMFEAVVAPAAEANAADATDIEAEATLQDAIPMMEAAEAEAAPENELLEDVESEPEAEEEAPRYDESGPQQLAMF
jgi:hypothetical protein